MQQDVNKEQVKKNIGKRHEVKPSLYFAEAGNWKKGRPEILALHFNPSLRIVSIFVIFIFAYLKFWTILKYHVTSRYLQAIKQCPNRAGTPPNCFPDYRVSIYRWFLICFRDSLSLVIPNNKRIEHWWLKVLFIAMLRPVFSWGN